MLTGGRIVCVLVRNNYVDTPHKNVILIIRLKSLALHIPVVLAHEIKIKTLHMTSIGVKF